MTIATARRNLAWAAPVYYVFLRSCFYFFSDPASRHIQESLASRQAACTIYGFASGWEDIRGIQMEGCIERLSPGMEAVEVIRAYLKKFSFTNEFFPPGEHLDLEAFSKRFRVRLYKFRPALVYYLDNRIRFGFRQSVGI
jgi:hypothetical protein